MLVPNSTYYNNLSLRYKGIKKRYFIGLKCVIFLMLILLALNYLLYGGGSNGVRDCSFFVIESRSGIVISVSGHVVDVFCIIFKSLSMKWNHSP